MNTAPPTECAAWRKLEAHAESWRGAKLAELLEADPARARNFVVTAPGLRLEYARQAVGGLTLKLLAQLAAERGFDQWRAALLAGQPVNSTEHRPAWHTALRAGEAAPQEVQSNLRKMLELCNALRQEKQFRRIVNLGTGGSDLGPRLLADAFGDGTLEVRFVANIDPVELERALAGAEPETTLIVVVSKTFTTQETLFNANKVKELLGEKTELYAVTANVEAARKFGAREILPMWDWVGGRFSVWSAAGFAGLCAIGAAAFEEILAGARDIDAHFAAAPVEDNVPALMALLGVWNVNFLGARAHAVLPYAHRLRLLPAYLQQLEMESNGKSVDREGRALAYATCPVLFGAEGTPSQHSFLQLLHQGTQAVPADFIDCAVSEALSANARAQADALAHGTQDPALPPHRRHPGHRPSSTIRLDRLDPRALGRLLALYEHKVFTQGVIWNINSFDQWGVELGKALARQILDRR